jgi:hypothetical protein
VARVTQPVTIDGRIAPGEWPDGELPLNQSPGRGLLETPRCVGRVCHDGSTLYVAVTVPVKDAQALKRGKAWGKDDGIEVCFVDAKGAQPTFSYSLHGFCGGEFESVTDGQATPEAAARLGRDVRYAAAVEGNTWTGEWAIPLEAADTGIVPGLRLAFNLCVYRSESNEWVLWAGTLGAAWQLENAGTLVFE